MIRGQKPDVKRLFDLIVRATLAEDKELRKGYRGFRFDPADCDGKGVADLYEESIRFMAYKALLLRSNLQVYIEDSYGKGQRRCDITLYYPKTRESIWVEVKVTGWCYDWEYKKWVRDDAVKMKRLRHKGAEKYLLVTSVEDEKPNLEEWNAWFKGELPMVEFNPTLFYYFGVSFSNGKTFEPGYYTISLLKVK